MLLNTTFNENSQSLSPWACWSRFGEFAHVSFECRSTTASHTAVTMRKPGRESSPQQNPTSQTEKRRGRKRGRQKRKYSLAPEKNNFPKFGSRREGEYDLRLAECCVQYASEHISIYNTECNVNASLFTSFKVCITYCGMLWKLLSVHHVGETKGWLSAPTEPFC